MIVETPRRVIARALADRPACEHAAVLRDFLIGASATLAALQGDRAAAEFVFRLADALVSLETAP